MKKIAINILKIGAILGLTYYLLDKTYGEEDFSIYSEVIENTNHFYFFLSIFFGFLSHISRSIRWKILLRAQNLEAPFKSLMFGTFFGYFVNIIIPRGGEVARCTSVSLKEKLPLDKLISTVIIERAIDFILLISLIFFVLFLNYDLFSGFFIEILNHLKNTLLNNSSLLIGVCTFFLLVVGFFFVFRKKLLAFKFVSKAEEFIRNILKGLISIKKLDKPFAFIGHTAFIWLMYFMMTYIGFFGIPELSNLGPVDGLFVFIFGGIGMTIPSPGGTGSYHFVVGQGMHEILGVAEHIGKSFALILHTYQTIFILCMGIISYIYFWSSYKTRKNESKSN